MLRGLTAALLLAAYPAFAAAQQFKDADFLPPKSDQPFTDTAVLGKPKPVKPSDKVEVPPVEQLLLGIPPLPPPPKVWWGGVELGAAGTSGNTEVLRVRLGFDLKRETPANLFLANGWYGLARQDGVIAENKALLNARDEVRIAKTRWGLFASSVVEYDEFRAYDLRVGLYGGLAYEFLKTERTMLRGRLGAGAQREFGDGVKDQWVPEGLAGFDLEHRLSQRSRFVTSVEAYPSFDEWGVRVRARAAYEVVVDPELNLMFRLGVQDRYDSDPGPAKRNDLDYFATVLLQF
jgi:putative salt-induced outer membrane protein YdiY